MVIRAFHAIALSSTLVSATMVKQPPAAPMVTLSSGTVFGTALPQSTPNAAPVNQFLGIPFAEATERWAPPLDFERPFPTNPLNATMWGRACLQVGSSPNATYGSEDCLKANVWTPVKRKHSTSKNMAVLVFIYGGSNQFGEAEPYNMSGLAAFQDVVCVNFNYRTGPIGWMAFESDVGKRGGTGNWGVLDIQSALRWVQREISAFGGDPARVAIHGQSSGAGLVELQLVAPDSRALFRAAISESGGLSATPLKRSLENTRSLAKAAGCLINATGEAEGGGGARAANNLVVSKACMLALSPLAITSMTYAGSWGPVIDGTTLPEDPMKMLLAGRVNPVDAAVFGAQTNDSFLFLSRDYTLNGDVQPNMHPDGDLVHMNASEYAATLRSMLRRASRKLQEEAIALYPPTPHPSIENVQSLGRVESDQMHCSNRRRARAFQRSRRPAAASPSSLSSRGFVYRFNSWYRSNRDCTAVPNFHLDYLGSVHQDEVTFVMGQPNFMEAGSCCGKWGLSEGEESCAHEPKCTRCFDEERFGKGYQAYFNSKEFEFAQTVGRLWASFASNGGPGHESPIWPDIGVGAVLLDADLDGGAAREVDLYGSNRTCTLWDALAQEE
jgi:carboxylesterase type B